jgi:enoyl-CoA hydratase
MTPVLRVERVDHTVVLTIDRPAARNAIDEAVLTGLDAALTVVAGDVEVRAVVVTGAGDKAFAAGGDIATMRSMSAGEAELFSTRGQRVFERLSQLQMPVIAAVNGVALGGGCELAMACDLVLASAAAKFGQPEVKLGVVPGFGGTQRLVRRVGWSNALDLCLTGRAIDAQEALRIGLVSRVVEGDVRAAAVALGAEIATLGPVAVRLCKRLVHDNADLPLTSALAAERTAFALCFATGDQKEGMTAFLEKRSPRFQGR